MQVQEANPLFQRFKGIMGRVLFFFVVFLAVSILLSIWMGYFWKNSFFIAAGAAIIAFFLCKKFPADLQVPKRIYLYALLFFILGTYNLILITPFYPASIDDAQIITERILAGNVIPLTYEPYAGTSANYYMSYHLVTRIFIDVFPVMSDFQWMAVMGALLAAIELIFVYLFSREFFKSELAAELAAILFLGTRMPILNILWGMHPMILGMLFLLIAAFFYLKKHPFAYIFFPLVFISHIGAAANAVILFWGFAIYFREKITAVLKYVSSLVLVLPLFLVVYLPVVIYLFGGRQASDSAASYGLSGLAEAYRMLPLWFGVIPVAILAFSLAYLLIFRIKIEKKKELFFLGGVFTFLFVIFSLLYLGFLIPGLATKLVSLMSILVLLIAGYLFSRIKFSGNLFVKLGVILACVLLFVTSGFVSNLQHGTEKMSPAAVEFAVHFQNFDPALKKVFFLTGNDSVSIATYANKIPYDKVTDFPRHIYVPIDKWQVPSNPAAYALLYDEKATADRIFAEKCIECVYNLDVDYLVIKKSYFNKLPSGNPVFVYGDYLVYLVN